MNRNSKYLTLAPAMAALLLAAACSNDDSVEGTDENVGGTDELVELRLTSSIEAQSRATHGLDEQFAAGEEIHVWVDDAGTGDELYENNVLAVGNDNYTLSGGDTMYFPSTGNCVDIYAIHGNFGEADLSESFWDTEITHTVASDQQSTVATAGAGYAGSDLLYCAVTDVARTKNAVGLTFKHLLSKVEVVLKQGNGAPSIKTVEIINTQLQAQFTPTKGSDIEVTAAGDTGAIVIDSDLSDDDATALNEAVIIPQALSEGTAFIRITTDEGGELVYSLDKTTTFAAGKKYHYIITVKLTGLEVTATVDDWETGLEDAAGDAQMGVDYTYTDTDGTRTYTVYNEAGLLEWSAYTRSGNWGTNCILAADITLSAPETDGGSNWTTVGVSSRYTGTFDGNGYTISGLTINASSDYQGLIGRLDNDGVVKNLTLENVSISSEGGECIGAVVAMNNGSVTGCCATGTVSGSHDTGGVVGENHGKITDCYFMGSVLGTNHVGGVAGRNSGSGTITDCHSTAAVTGEWYTGGVVGYSFGSVTACSASGTVKGVYFTGGMMGVSEGSVTACSVSGTVKGDYLTGGVVGEDHGNVTACYSAGTVSGTTNTGGVAGYIGSGTITACYSTGTISGTTSTGGVVGDNDGGTVSTCYWYSSASDSYATYVDGTEVTWSDALTAMNEALSNGGYSWEYVENEDENEPLKLASTATE